MLLARRPPSCAASGVSLTTNAAVTLPRSSNNLHGHQASSIVKRTQTSRIGTRSFAALSSSPCLVVAEHDTAKIQAGTLNTITAASQLSSDVTVLLAGSFQGKGKDLASEVAKLQGVKRVVLADNAAFAHFLPEVFTPLIVGCQRYFQSKFVLAPSSTFGKNVLPRVAGVLDVSGLTDVVAIKSNDTFVRPIYAGNALATVKSSDAVQVLTIRTTAFEKAKASDEGVATVDALPAEVESQISTVAASVKSRWVKDELKQSTRPDLSSASIVVSGGRGMKSGENFKLLEDLADQLGAAVGASRAAVDAGFVSNDLQVGQTGKIVAPSLYIAVGISGAIQHLAGMKDSKTIVAINKDADAPIFQLADYGVVGDLFTVVPEITNLVKQAKAQK